MDVHPPKNGIYRYWPIPIFLRISLQALNPQKEWEKDGKSMNTSCGMAGQSFWKGWHQDTTKTHKNGNVIVFAHGKPGARLASLQDESSQNNQFETNAISGRANWQCWYFDTTKDLIRCCCHMLDCYSFPGSSTCQKLQSQYLLGGKIRGRSPALAGHSQASAQSLWPVQFPWDQLSLRQVAGKTK